MDIERKDVRKRRNLRRTAIAGLAILIGTSLAASFYFVNNAPVIGRDKIWLGLVRRTTFVDEVTGSGTLVSRDVRAIADQSEGVVERIAALPGQQVLPDTVLMILTNPQLQESLAKAQLELAASEAEARASEIDLENRERDAMAEAAAAESDYTSSLLELQAKERVPGIIPRIEIEQMRLKTEQLKKRLDAERARSATFAQYRRAQERATAAHIAELRHDFESERTQVAQLTVRAGVKGVLQEVDVQNGERLTRGEVVARVVDPSDLIAQVAVSEQDASTVRLGMPVTLEIGNQMLAGKVIRIDPTVKDELVKVDAELADPMPKDIRPDLSVTAEICVAHVPNALVLDRPIGLKSGFETVDLYRIEAGGTTARLVPVRIGRASAREVEVLDGVRAGDQVILSEIPEGDAKPSIRIR